MKALHCISVLLACLVVLAGCRKEEHEVPAPVRKSVLLFYGAGYNNLSSDISGNISTILKNDLPQRHSNHKLLIFSHLSVSDNNCTTPVPSSLCEVYKTLGGLVIRDTLLKVDASRTASDPAVFKEVLEFVQDRYPGASCGVIMSSHGTGWLPAGDYYGGYSNVIQYRKGISPSEAGADGNLPPYRYNMDPSCPKVKTFGAEFTKIEGTVYSKEMSITSLAEAIPMHLDFMVFDACLMGAVEVAYQLRNKVDKLVFSPTEVLAAGFDYSNLRGQFLVDNPSPEAFAKAYFDKYRKSSATVSVVATSGLQALAEVCAALNEKYRTAMDALDDDDEVQPYFRYSYSWFYDLEDIYIKAGAGIEDRARLRAALNGCISYKAATESFMTWYGGFHIGQFSGLSMFLPSMSGSDVATAYYKGLDWNGAVNLVE